MEIEAGDVSTSMKQEILTEPRHQFDGSVANAGGKLDENVKN